MAREFTACLEGASIRISMDGPRGRALANVFIERLWRSVKYEDIYLKDYASVPALDAGLQAYFQFYNQDHPHPHRGVEEGQVYFLDIGFLKDHLGLHFAS